MKEQKPSTDFLSKESAFHYGYAADLIKPCCRGQKEPQEFKMEVTPGQSETVQIAITGTYKVYKYPYIFVTHRGISWSDLRIVFEGDKLPELTFAEWERIYMQKEPHQEFEKYTLLKDLNWFGITIPKGSTYEQCKSTHDKYRCFVNGNECPHWDLTFMTIKNKPEWFELQKPKSKEQQLYEYFADNHDIQLMSTDIQEIERIVKDLCQCENRTSFISNLCKKCKKYIY